MTEYIEREKAQDGLDNIDWYHVNDKGQLIPGGKTDIETYVPFKAVEEMLKSIPAADVRPVVLCRDCQNSYEWANVDGDNYRYCGYLRSRWNHDMDRMVDDDDFCKWGRKREER